MLATQGIVATKKPKLTAYVSEWVDRAIDQVATQERRSRSQMIALLIEEALKARGYEVPEEEINPEVSTMGDKP